MYGVNSSPDSISRDMNSVFYSSTFKQLISSHPYPNYNYNQIQIQQQQQMKLESDVSNFVQYGPLMKEEKEGDDRKPPSTPARANGEPSSNGSSYGYSNRSNLDSTSTNLMRQNTTPAGLLSLLSAANGSASMKNGSSSSTLNNHISYSLESSSPSRFLRQIAGNKNELQDSTFSSLKRSRDGVLKMPQNGETGNHTPNLVHHMSLPKTSSEMAFVENSLQFQQESTVPWKVRAKRGCATHPRSIAERVRRTRISERIKRLQELFPDMDKQCNTADMLDMAVEHIKNLQKELQTLSDARARCQCSSKQVRST